MDLVNRLKLYMESKGIAISQFADTCTIPRPTMSQILNGRNKKISDELISKIHVAYPDLSVLWLMFGEGAMTTDANMQTSAPQIPSDSSESRAYFSENESDARAASPISAVTDSARNSASGQYIVDFENFSYPDSSSSPQRDGTPDDARTESRAPSSDSLIDFEALGDPVATEPLHTSPEPHRSPADRDSSRPSAWQSPSPDPSPASTTATPSDSPSVVLPTAPGKRITNIVVFYSDNSFQSFYPAML